MSSFMKALDIRLIVSNWHDVKKPDLVWFYVLDKLYGMIIFRDREYIGNKRHM